MSEDGRFRILKNVALRKPTLVAAWPGMGLVGVNAVEFLRSSLEAEKIAEIEAGDYFSVQGIQVKEGLSVPLRVPTNTFHAWIRPAGPPDLLLFLGTAQPVNGRELNMSSLVLDAARRLGVTRIFTAAAMASQIDHLAPSKVFAVSNCAPEADALRKLGVQMLQEGEVGGLNGLLIGVAQQMDLPGSCLMGEMPHYTTHIENPKASKAVLGVLAQLLSIELDLTPLAERARYIETQIQGFLQAARARSEQQEAGGEPSEGEEPGASESEGESEGEEEGGGEAGPGKGSSTPPKPAIN